MFNHLFRQLFNSFGIFFRTIRAFFTRRFIGLGARLRRMLNFSRHATQVASKSFQGAAAAMKKPTRREDYVETKWLFVSKSFLIKLLLGLVALGLLIYFVIWPFLLGKFFTAHFWQEDPKAENWSGKVVLYHDEEKTVPKLEGRLTDGVINGKGKEYDSDGLLSYEGEFSEGLHHGAGTVYEAGVISYTGELSEGIYDGKGVLYENGTVLYDGSFLAGVPSGTGSLFEDGVLLYEGGFLEGVYDGTGTLYHPNGEVCYTGGFSGGSYSGKGKLTDTDGKPIYEGGFAEGLYEGEGTLYDSGLLAYTGGFSGGLRSGEGAEYDPDGTLRYKGGFAEDLRSGEGTAYRPDGSVCYKGGFANGLYEGDGVLYLDDGSRIEAAFAAGQNDGPIRWYIDDLLWYAGGADQMIPDGYGEIFTRSGKKIYAGELDRGTIDGAWLLSLTAEEVREVFCDATVLEEPARDGGFFVINRELGVVVRCMYRSEESDTSVFSVWISRENTREAWQDVTVFHKWTEDLKTEAGISNLMAWPDAESFAHWVQAMEPAGHTAFPEHDLQKERYFFDGWYCTAAVDPGTGIPNMVSWTVDLQLQAPSGESELPEAVAAVQQEVDALLTQLGLTEDTPSEPAENAMQAHLMRFASMHTICDMLGAMIDYGENDRALQALLSTQEQLQLRLEDAQQRLDMGSGSADEVEDIQLQLDAYQLRISKCTANQAKALLILEEKLPFDPEMLDLSLLFLCFDPTTLSEETVCEEVSLHDQIAAKTSLINLQVSYETVLYSVKALEQADKAVANAADAFSRGELDQLELGQRLIARSDAVVSVYGALAGFTREINTLNRLTHGWLAVELGWFSEAFAEYV